MSSDTPTIYIAYRRVDGRTPSGIHRFTESLKKIPFEPVLDTGKIASDEEWLTETRKRIEACDVMCVLIDETTADSTWIKQEIDWANTSGVPVLSVVLDETKSIHLERLGLQDIQYVFFDSTHGDLGSIVLILIQMVLVSRKRLMKSRLIILDKQASLPNYTIFTDNQLKPSINGVFNNPSQDPQYDCDIFVIMPFREPFNTIFKDHIKPFGSKYGLKIKRGDDFFSRGSIMSEVWSAMFNAYIVIAECTGRNPNVFYELGIAHTLNKPGILITQNIDDIPFNIQHLRNIPYEYTPHGVGELERNLEKAIVKLLYGEDLK
ncbi:MAG: toll/interleukin-1 receptor domain-containing protein [Chloroflexota bacterium]